MPTEEEQKKIDNLNAKKRAKREQTENRPVAEEYPPKAILNIPAPPPADPSKSILG